MVKRCVICGKRIRTGWKYCYEHRNTRRPAQKKDSFVLITCILFTLGVLMIAYNKWLFGIVCLLFSFLLIFFKYKHKLINIKRRCPRCGAKVESQDKFCPACRGKLKKFRIDTLIFFSLILLMVLVFLYFTLNEKVKPEEGIEEVPATQEDLKNFCSAKFYELDGTTKTINSINYFEDYSSASLWLEEKYPYIEGVTQNFPKNFKENYLDKVKFPIYLIDGTIEGREFFSNKLYACDETGIFL